MLFHSCECFFIVDKIAASVFLTPDSHVMLPLSAKSNQPKEHETEDEGSHVVVGSEDEHISITGHGQIMLANALMFEGENLMLLTDDSTVHLQTGDVQSYQVDVPALDSAKGFLKVCATLFLYLRWSSGKA